MAGLIDYREYKRCLNNRDSEGLKDWAVHEIYLDIADSLAKIVTALESAKKEAASEEAASDETENNER